MFDLERAHCDRVNICSSTTIIEGVAFHTTPQPQPRRSLRFTSHGLINLLLHRGADISYPSIPTEQVTNRDSTRDSSQPDTARNLDTLSLR